MSNPNAPRTPSAGDGALASTFRQAQALHEAGQLAPAEQAYRQILSAAPDHADALHMFGILLIQTNRAGPGFELIDRALAVRPDFVDAHFNRGVALMQLQRPDLALDSFDRALALRKGMVEAHYNRGVALMQLGRAEAALASFDKALSRRPGHLEAMLNRGVVLSSLGQPEKALVSFNKLLSIQPGHLDALANRGLALAALGRPDDALASFDRVLALDPRHPAALLNRGVALSELHRFDEALASLDRGLAVRANDAEALFNRAGVLKALHRLDEALDSLDRALAIRADYPRTWVNRGVVLKMLGRPAEAVQAYDRALKHQPASVEAHISRGAALAELQRFDEAIASYDQALALAPSSESARFNKSLVLLQTGRFEEGWPLYEHRIALAARPRLLHPGQPVWDGRAPLSGKTLLVCWEQGFGDTINFCRYASLAADAGATVILSVQEELVSLIDGFDPRVAVIGDRTPAAFDFYAPLLSLPRAFGTTAQTIPGRAAYLTADADRAAAWASYLGDRRPRVGLVWSGGAAHENDRNRSIPLAKLAPLFDVDADWASLQKEIRDGDRDVLARLPRLATVEDRLTDFAETAALIANLDLVIAVDTSVAHLAAALGKPTWLLLPFTPDWRWGLSGEDTAWYPSMRLFRQPAAGDWDSVIEQVRAALALVR